MRRLQSFLKSAPADFCPQATCDPTQRYKYLLTGKGCTLGVLFEDSVHVYVEWLTEAGAVVPYGPDLRYKQWPRHEVDRLRATGLWTTLYFN